MENNISKHFYLLCKNEGIINLDSKADVARIILVAENNGISGTEEELINQFHLGKDTVKKDLESEKIKEHEKKVSELRNKEIKHIKDAKKLSKYVGREKTISRYEEKMDVLRSQIDDCKAKIRDFQEKSTAVYSTGVKKEKDWAIHGGIASGIAGGAAGLATAFEIQQQNAEARIHNQNLLKNTALAQLSVTQQYNAEIKRLQAEIDENWEKVQFHKKRLVDKLEPSDLLIKLKPRLIKQEYTETGAVKLTVEIQPTPDIFIYDNVKAVVDGSFKALLIDNDEVLGEVVFALPYSGATKKNRLVGYCIDSQNFKNKKFDVVFLPINLWAIEEKGNIDKVDDEVTIGADYLNRMMYYSAKLILKNENVGVDEYSKAVKILENITDYEKAKELERVCKSQINAIKEKKEAERIEQERREQEERAENARIAKRNKKIAIIVSPFVAALIIFVIVLNTVIMPEKRYEEAMLLMENQKYEEALERFSLLGNIKDSREQYENALILCNEKWRNRISAGYEHTVGLRKDGTAIATKHYGKFPFVNEYHGQCEVSEWTDIVAISAGGDHTLGLKSNGTVIATRRQNYLIEIDVENWTDIIAISAGDAHAVGLKADGTVVATGYNKYGQCNVSEWTDIVAISAGGSHTVGLKSNGTVIAVGDQGCGVYYVSEWKDIIAISAGDTNIVGLKSNGTVVAAGNKYSGVNNVSNWTDIIAISAGGNIAGLKSDGTVIIVDEDVENKATDWKNIIAISDGPLHTVGLKADGEIVTIKADLGPECFSGQCDVQDWNLFR